MLNRYCDEFADYGRYLDHTAHRVSYVTVPGHVPMIPPQRGHIETVDSFKDPEPVLAAAERCHRAAGPFDAVLALSEFDLLTGARVRELLGVPGPDVRATLLVRDKTVMKEAVARAGLRVPRYATVRSADDVAAFARSCAGPVVVKPRTGAASVGVVVVRDASDPLPDLSGGAPEGGHPEEAYEVEEFLEGPIWHVDGLRHRGATVFRLASRYLGTCHGFTLGEPLGSVVVRDTEADAVADFADRCLDALGLADGPYHLEVIQHPDGLAFLEVGARVGGGEIPFVLHEVYGVDLFHEWIRVLLGEDPVGIPASGPDPQEHAGFLMLPEPKGRTLLSRESMLGRVPHLYAEELPRPGHHFDGSGGYETILGRFRYRGPSAKDVEQAIMETIASYAFELAGEH
jgi:biotin carboxylase